MPQAMKSPAVIENAPESPVDTSDVPRVGARELALALKILSAGNGLLLPVVTLSDEDLRRVEQDFWQISPRARVRKVAVLLRFRSFLAACQTRHVSDLIARHGQMALVIALEAAANMRLNAKWGFNPVKMARAMSEALAATADGFDGQTAAA
ncbi:hypothetical protein [Hyphomicrobium sp.]|uniref:hypothetical protein n=1 Tax=Hyphomicrobium sp. TaxID=82 RepID=UPI0025BB96FF|nr:hypothetical protein [Hyphomicrobium sp.]MCC7254163.1 hypothetical protein [Hyphomicrobium sp.]